MTRFLYIATTLVVVLCAASDAAGQSRAGPPPFVASNAFTWQDDAHDWNIELDVVFGSPMPAAPETVFHGEVGSVQLPAVSYPTASMVSSPTAIHLLFYVPGRLHGALTRRPDRLVVVQQRGSDPPARVTVAVASAPTDSLRLGIEVATARVTREYDPQPMPLPSRDEWRVRLRATLQNTTAQPIAFSRALLNAHDGATVYALITDAPLAYPNEIAPHAAVPLTLTFASASTAPAPRALTVEYGRPGHARITQHIALPAPP